MKKYLLLLFLVLLLPFSAFAGTFMDVNQPDWYYPYVEDLAARDAISTDSSLYRPGDLGTRAEVVKMIVNGFGLQLEYPSLQTFSDVPKTEWYFPYVEAAVKNRIIEGYRDEYGNLNGHFGPNDFVTREQLMKIVINGMMFTIITAGGPHFNDVSSENWSYDFIESAYNWQIVSGYDGGSFKPYDFVNRAELAKVMSLASGDRAVPGPVPTPEPVQPQPTSPDCTSSRFFNTLVFMDDSSYTVSDSEINDYFDIASKELNDRTCVKFNVLKIWHVNLASDAERLPSIYKILAENKDLLDQANYYVMFSEYPDCSHLNGGCTAALFPSMAEIGDQAYCNTFANAKSEDTLLYGANVDWNHMYGRCGYDDTETHVSEVSIGGECRNVPGTQCVYNDDFGYYMCNNVLDEYYASEKYMMTISTIIHEIMHQFGTGVDGAMDHTVGSDACLAEYKGTLNYLCPASAELSNCWFNICQYAYENFRDAENLCQ